MITNGGSWVWCWDVFFWIWCRWRLCLVILDISCGCSLLFSVV
jgi:hypothetical protein